MIGQVRLTFDDLGLSLGLADGVKITGIVVDPLTRTAALVVEGFGIETPDDGQQPGTEPYAVKLGAVQRGTSFIEAGRCSNCRGDSFVTGVDSRAALCSTCGMWAALPTKGFFEVERSGT